MFFERITCKSKQSPSFISSKLSDILHPVVLKKEKKKSQISQHKIQINLKEPDVTEQFGLRCPLRAKIYKKHLL